MPATNFLTWLEKQQEQDHKGTIAYILAAGIHDQQKESLRTKRRLDAQVDAMYKAKCGDLYQPPDILGSEDDEMQITFLNSPIIGDDAMTQIRQMESAGLAAENNQSVPPQSKTPFWKKALMVGLPVLAAGGIGAAAAYFLQGDPAFDMQALPYRPGQ